MAVFCSPYFLGMDKVNPPSAYNSFPSAKLFGHTLCTFFNLSNEGLLHTILFSGNYGEYHANKLNYLYLKSTHGLSFVKLQKRFLFFFF